MTEKDFFEEYDRRLRAKVTEFKTEIENSNETNATHFFKRSIWLQHQITVFADDLISTILVENNFSPTFQVIQNTKSGSAIVALASDLLLKSSRFKKPILSDFNSFVEDQLDLRFQ